LEEPRIHHTGDFGRPKGLISIFSIGYYVSIIGKIGSKSDVYRRLPKFYNFATFSLKILCLFHRVHVIILITSVSRNTVNKIDGKIKGVNVKKVLVTGGSGFVGRKLINELLNRYPDIEVTSMSRSEGVISKLLTECPDKRLKISITDVRDSEAVKQVLRDKDTVFHLAAMKRVDLSEVECRLAVTINVLGTMNILDAFHGKTFILMSTDKAVEPVNCYGATKLVAEKLVMERAMKAGDGERFMIIRSGNIVGSTGSVIDIWKKQIEKYNEITVTDLEMIRYYTSVEGVAKLFFALVDRGENGKIYFTPTGEPQMLKDVVDTVVKLYGNKETKVKCIGLRDGERMYEKMCTPAEKNVVGEFVDVNDTRFPQSNMKCDNEKIFST
jgi:FlaA1/EpsC-like NDP-sugar epimerase